MTATAMQQVTTEDVTQGTLISTDDDFTHLNGLLLFFDKIII